MKISRMWQFFMIINLTHLTFIMNISCIGEKFITPGRRGLTLKKKIMKNCISQEIITTKSKQKKEK